MTANEQEEAPTRVVVTLSEEATGDIEETVRRLEEAGLAVEEVLDFIGQVVGRCSPESLSPLRELEGVADVSESRPIQLPPPGSVIQ